MTAILVRRSFEASPRRLDPEPIMHGDEILFQGDLPTAIQAAKALRLAERMFVSLETDQGTFGPDDFDALAVDASPFRELDLAHGRMTIRVTAEAQERLRGDRPHPVAPMMLISDNLDRLNAIVRGKLAAGLIRDEGGKRIVVIDAADLA